MGLPPDHLLLDGLTSPGQAFIQPYRPCPVPYRFLAAL